jgi:hypothetical protein
MVLSFLPAFTVNAESIIRKLFDTERIASGEPGRTRFMVRSTFNGLERASSDLLVVRLGAGCGAAPAERKRARKGFATAVVVAGSLMMPSTAPALLKSASDRATDLSGYNSTVDSGLEGFGALAAGDSYRSADLFAAAGGASSLPTEAYPLTGTRRCNPSSGINTIVPAANDSTSASPTHEGICFGPHDMIEYYVFRGNADRRPVDFDYNGVPSTVRSHIADSQLFRDPPTVVATAEQGDYESREPHSARTSRTAHLSTPAKPSSAPISHKRRASTLHPSGCSRCPAQIVQSSPRRARTFAFVFPIDFFRHARSGRGEHLPGGVARQREAPRVAAWNLWPS